MGTVSRAIDTVTNAIITKNDIFIKWSYKEGILKSKQKFTEWISRLYRWNSCPNVQMQASLEDEAVFVKRKGVSFHQCTGHW